MALPSYSLICLQQEDQSCHAPFGLPSMVYAVPKNDPIAGVDTDGDDVERAVEQSTGDSLYQLDDECVLLRTFDQPDCSVRARHLQRQSSPRSGRDPSRAGTSGGWGRVQAAARRGGHGARPRRG